MKNKKLWIWVGSIIAVICLAFAGLGYYFFNVACVPSQKSFLSNDSAKPKKTDPLYREKEWYFKQKKEKWHILSADDKYKLDANYIPDKGSTKTAIILHGYMSNKDKMSAYAALFHKLGYNVLLPDARAHGDSQGKYIGYGWIEKTDVKKWARDVVHNKGKRSEIVIFGVSMGGATTMMASGEKLPSQVKAFIEDCGYTSVKDEIEHEAQDLYHLPAFPRFPLVEIVSGINKAKVGYYFADGSSVNQLKKNHKPMLFIHGKKDNFVPTRMVYKNYAATKGPKQLWLVPNAAHAESYEKHPQAYESHIKSFLNKYVH